MISWLTEHWLDLAVGAAVLGIAVLCLRNILPRKGKPTACNCGSGSCDSCPFCHK